MLGLYFKYHKRKQKPAGRRRQKIPAGFLFVWILVAAVLLCSVIPAKAFVMQPQQQRIVHWNNRSKQNSNTLQVDKEQKITDNDLHALSAVLMDGENAGSCMIKQVKKFVQMPVRRRSLPVSWHLNMVIWTIRWSYLPMQQRCRMYSLISERERNIS